MPSNSAVLANLVKHMKNAGVDPLSPKIDKYLLKRSKAKKRLGSYTVDLMGRPRKPGRFSPSDLNACERKAAFSFLGLKRVRKVDPTSEMIMEFGNWVHAMCYAIFLDMQLVLGKKEFKVRKIEYDIEIPDLYIAGTLDAELEIDGQKVLWDGKSINSWGWNKIMATNKPDPKHRQQILAYLKARKIPTGLICYINKDNQQMRVFIVKYAVQKWSHTEKWIQRVTRKMEAGRVPPKHSECKRGNFMYDKCPFSRYCFGSKAPSEEELAELMYKNFKGVDKEWLKHRAS
jgi:hypothetical protein